MAAKCKLTYFNARGRAELPRLIFAYAGVEFVDERLDRDQFAERKASGAFMFGSVPVLEVDGKQLAQSLAIARYVARQNGLVPADDFRAAQCDMWVDYVGDAAAKVVPLIFEQDQEKKTAGFKAFFTEFFGGWCATWAKALEANATGYIVGDSMTWADLAVFNFLSSIKSVGIQGGFDTVPPSLKAHHERVGSHPNIKKYIDARAVTPF